MQDRRWIAVSVLAGSCCLFGLLGRETGDISFNEDVRPILNEKCISCHGGVKQSGGFSVLFREEALGVTESGKPAIIPGSPDESEFMKRITSHDPAIRMPLDREPLTEKEIDIFRRWITQGADWAVHWAFLPPEKTVPPAISYKEFVKNDIDRFVLEKMKRVGLLPAGEADKATLIRRVSLDLTGLPPDSGLVREFMDDPSPDAYEKLVDTLLQSPAYGERWTAMWLDLARYADSKGYEKDQYRNIWRYRDYLIRSFNEDKPYDQFTVEQLAGDLLPDAQEEEVIATAFHRNTMSNDESGTDDEEFRTAAVIDRVNTTFDVWQGITMSCVQCHSHPYDPIRHEEYFRFMAFLNNTRDADLREDAPTLVTGDDYDSTKIRQLVASIENVTADNQPVPGSFKELRRKYLFPSVLAKDFDGLHQADFNHPAVKLSEEGAYLRFDRIDFRDVRSIGCTYVSDEGATVEIRLDRPDGKLIAVMDALSTFNVYHTKSVAIKPASGVHQVFFVFRPGKGKASGDIRMLSFYFGIARSDSLRAELAKAINPEGTPVFEELAGADRRKTHVFVRGNRTEKGEEVAPGVPQALNPFPDGAPKNRLGMAGWLASPENPLTARVAVNRFWEQLFGLGIVETPEDFGSQGIKPTHPELLDWLAVTFMKEYGWQMKKLLKLIVTSGTYRQSSAMLPHHLEKDPRNRWLSRGPRVRLTAEQIRDQALAVSGLLSAKMYGPSVMPHQPAGIWQTVYNADKWILSEGEDRYRRSIYTFIKRTSPYPNMISFDAPSREFCMVRRIPTNTPLQALAMLNDTVYTEVSQAIGKKIRYLGNGDIKEGISKVFSTALVRNIDEPTLNELLKLYNRSVVSFRSRGAEQAQWMSGRKENAIQQAALTVVGSAIINLDEFIMKE